MQYETKVTVAQVEACLALFEAAQALCEEAGEQRYGAVIVREAVVRACMEAVEQVRKEWNW
mgnify:CR=1 FL=1